MIVKPRTVAALWNGDVIQISLHHKQMWEAEIKGDVVRLKYRNITMKLSYVDFKYYFVEVKND